MSLDVRDPDILFKYHNLILSVKDGDLPLRHNLYFQGAVLFIRTTVQYTMNQHRWCVCV